MDALLFLFLQIFPITLVLLLLLVGGRPPWQAALAGVLSAGVLWYSGAALPYTAAAAYAAAVDTALLFAGVAAVMAPGLLLVVLLAHTNANRALTEWVIGSGLGGERQVLFVVLGLAPMLEALTGFGVSLIAVLPVLLATLPRSAALKVAFSAMAVMPWGTMGLATLTGATLADLSPAALGAHSAITSAPVFVMLALLAVWFAGYRHLRAFAQTVVLAIFFVSALYAASRFLGAEVAGMCAGMAVMILLLLGKQVRLPHEAWPYGLIFIGILCSKLLWWMMPWAGAWRWQGAQVVYRPLHSPGVVLLVVAIVLACHYRPRYHVRAVATAWLNRAWRPLLTIFCFLVLSQIMVKGGFLNGVRDITATLDDTWLMPMLSALGALGGYLTGSAVGGNALMMPGLAAGKIWQAALINSAAGHAALGALPMVALIGGLAQAQASEERQMARFAFALVLVNTLLVAAVGYYISN